jgi:hypothetical protein
MTIAVQLGIIMYIMMGTGTFLGATYSAFTEKDNLSVSDQAAIIIVDAIAAVFFPVFWSARIVIIMLRS